MPVEQIGCTPASNGVRLDAEVVCFDSGPSPLFRVVTYDADDGAIISIAFFDTAGAPAVPTGAPTPCGDGPGATVNVIGPVGPGACEDAVRVLACAPMEVTADPAADLTAHRVNLLGALTWAVGVDTVGKVHSVTFRRRPGGAAGAVTISDALGVVTTLLAGESESWSITGLEDELVGPLSITGGVGTDLIINWVEL